MGSSLGVGLSGRDCWHSDGPGQIVRGAKGVFWVRENGGDQRESLSLFLSFSVRPGHCPGAGLGRKVALREGLTCDIN